MPLCSAIKRDGARCKVSVVPGVELCWVHDPRNASQRKRITSKAGKSKPNRDVADIKRRLSELADDVLAGSVDKGVGAVVSQVLNVYLRAVAIELKVLETQELEERLVELETMLNQKGRTGWG